MPGSVTIVTREAATAASTAPPPSSATRRAARAALSFGAATATRVLTRPSCTPGQAAIAPSVGTSSFLALMNTNATTSAAASSTAPQKNETW